ncbi:MAG: radical SAM family heme chaperone HemW, partial [Erysipelotrichaceae bacterium]
MMNKPVESLYLHVPFCDQICAYCDFYRCKTHPHLVDKWLEGIEHDLQDVRLNRHLKTIYLGGGTPSALREDQLERLLQALDPYSAQCVEFTVEVNPESLSQAKLNLMAKHRVNRISMGVQSFQPRLQALIARSVDQDIAAWIDAIHTAGIPHISIDLIYGLPTQTMEEWKADLQQALMLSIDHLSLYALTIEAHSAFGRQGIEKMEEELEGDMYEYAIATLPTGGFEHYEVSSFARNHAYSLHNLAYWSYADFYGIGPGASGKEGALRYTQSTRLDHYLIGKRERKNETLRSSDQFFEAIMMGLRTKWGVEFDTLA